MKRFILSILLFLALASPAQAIVTYNADYLTGGAQRSLDYISVNDLNNGDRAIVVNTSGVTPYYHYFKYDSSGTTVEQTASHPYYVRPDDYIASGVWYEVAPNWVDVGSSLTIQNLTVTDTNTVNNVDASGWLSGSLPVTKLKAGTYNLSGVSQRGGLIHNLNALSEVTAVLTSATRGDSAIFLLARDMVSGSTIWVQFNAADKILNYTAFITGTGAGTSYYLLSSSDASGVSGDGISIVSPANGYWYVYQNGSPTAGTK